MIVSDKKHPVVELFGPTLQGEGEAFGKISDFIRFGGCSFRCEWCDSLHAVLPAAIKLNADYLTEDEIVERVKELDSPAQIITFTGGDPVMHNFTAKLGYDLAAIRKRVYVETQGVLWQDWLKSVALLTVSPKGPSSGMSDKYDSKMIEEYIRVVGKRHIHIKVVCFNLDDIRFAKEIRNTFPDMSMSLSAGTVPGMNPLHYPNVIIERWRWLVESCLHEPIWQNTKILMQGHALLWGHEKGK